MNKLNVGKELVKRLKRFNENIEENMNQSYTITTDNTQPIMNQPHKHQQNQKPCLHDSCPSCDGTGARKDGLGSCTHMISCPCPKCTPCSM